MAPGLHRGAATVSMTQVAKATSDARREISNGACQTGLRKLLDAAKLLGQAEAHAESAEDRSAMTIASRQRMLIDRAAIEFVTACAVSRRR